MKTIAKVTKVSSKVIKVAESTKVTKSKVDQLLDKVNFAALLNSLTVIKDENCHLLKFTPKEYHLLTTGTNNRSQGKQYGDHQKNILESVNMCGITTAICVTIENGKFYVAEGGNRFTAWKKQGFTIYAFVSKASFSDTFTMMNLNVKPLKYTELLQHCSIEGDYQKHYKVLVELTAKHKAIAKGKVNSIQESLIHSLLSGIERVKSAQIVKSKKFVTTPELIAYTNKAIQQMYDLQIIGNICKNYRAELPRINEAFVALFAEKGDDYNHFLMVERLANTTIAWSSNKNRNINMLVDLHDKK